MSFASCWKLTRLRGQGAATVVRETVPIVESSSLDGGPQVKAD
ncbi:hypothetical protein SAMN05661103_0284 [Agrobacterium sp. 719_389]|nr:hypothetical protein SAMN05661103_0284 [Agrobacterium sp. 719_389]